MKRRIPIYGKAVLVFLIALFVYLVVVPLARPLYQGSFLAGMS